MQYIFKRDEVEVLQATTEEARWLKINLGDWNVSMI
jgi:hypothetical protein